MNAFLCIIGTLIIFLGTGLFIIYMAVRNIFKNDQDEEQQ